MVSRPKPSSRISGYTPEQEREDRLRDLPTSAQVDALVSRLPKLRLQEMTADLLRQNIALARQPGAPLDFVRFLTDWLATAQEVAAMGPRVREVLQDREDMRRKQVQ